MEPRAFVSSPLISVGLVLAFAFAMTTAIASRGSDGKAAMSCFAIASQVVCIEAGHVPVAPIVPAVTGPIGPNFDGEHEDIVIRDDGGRQVATG